jgi:PST family polysaccharide transporter
MIGGVEILIKLLLSDKFIEISTLVIVLGFSIPLKALTWTMGFLYLSKGDSKYFLYVEIGAKVISLTFSVLGFYFFGLIGIGYAQIAAFSVALLGNSFFMKGRYNFALSKEVFQLFFISLFFLLSIFIFDSMDNQLFKIIKWLVIGFSITYSGFLLNKRMQLISAIRNKFSR